MLITESLVLLRIINCLFGMDKTFKNETVADNVRDE
jgi:hypothetical protein